MTGACQWCQGEGRVEVFNFTRLAEEEISCPRCRGTGKDERGASSTVRVVVPRGRPYPGWDVGPKPVVSRGAIAWTAAAFLVVIGLAGIVVLQLLSTPRPGPDPTAGPSSSPGPTAGAGDLRVSTAGASGGSQGGAPSSGYVVVLGRPLGAPLTVAQLGSVVEQGGLAQAKRSLGDGYLAIRAPRGTLVHVCGPAGCLVMTSTDVGPEQGSGKVADVALVAWRKVCGLPDGAGVCQGSIEYPWSAQPTLPPTDVAP